MTRTDRLTLALNDTPAIGLTHVDTFMTTEMLATVSHFNFAPKNILPLMCSFSPTESTMTVYMDARTRLQAPQALTQRLQLFMRATPENHRGIDRKPSRTPLTQSPMASRQ